VRKRSIARVGSDEATLEALVERSRHGDEGAWAELWLALAPRVESVARCWWITGRLSRCPDGRRDIVVRVMGELREDGFRRLADLGERLARRDGSFRGWLWAVARNAAISHVREQPEYLGPGEGEDRRWASHEPLSETLEEESAPVSRQIEARRILARSRDVLEPGQLEALHRWLQGEDCAEIDGALGQGEGAGAAARLRRSALARLRARFAPAGGAPGDLRTKR
jgi:DNA-directed RNA polymerase specialized sigma24 family protein